MNNTWLLFIIYTRGEVSEWLKEHAWKACLRENVTWVRIPPSPPFPNLFMKTIVKINFFLALIMSQVWSASFTLTFREPQKNLDEKEFSDIVWLTKKIIPLAKKDNSWDIVVVNEHSGIEGTKSACKYEFPGGDFYFDGGLFLEKWTLEPFKGPKSVKVISSLEIAKQLDYNMGIENPDKLCTLQETLKKNMRMFSNNFPCCRLRPYGI